MGRTELDTADEISASNVQSDRLLAWREIHHDVVLQADRGSRRRPGLITGGRREELHHLGRRDGETATLIPDARPSDHSGKREQPARQEKGTVAGFQVVVRRQVRRSHAGRPVDIRLRTPQNGPHGQNIHQDRRRHGLRMVTRASAARLGQDVRAALLLLDPGNRQQPGQSRPHEHPVQGDCADEEPLQRHRRQAPLAVAGHLRLRQGGPALQVEKVAGDQPRNLPRPRKGRPRRGRRLDQGHRHQFRLGAQGRSLRPHHHRRGRYDHRRAPQNRRVVLLPRKDQRRRRGQLQAHPHHREEEQQRHLLVTQGPLRHRGHRPLPAELRPRLLGSRLRGREARERQRPHRQLTADEHGRPLRSHGRGLGPYGPLLRDERQCLETHRKLTSTPTPTPSPLLADHDPKMENGYHLYDFKGELLREEHIEKFKQLSWRPRPLTLLSRDEQKTIRKNLREYSKDFEEQDRIEEDKEKGAIVEERRRILSEWLAWREKEEEELKEERRDLGLTEEDDEDEDDDKADGKDGAGAVVEEIMEEVLDEVEEIA